MSTIVSWSPVHGQGANTTNTVALASAMAFDNSYKALLTYTQFDNSPLESIFNEDKEGQFDDKGFGALGRLVKSNLLKEDAIIDYTDTIIRNRLDFLPGNQRNIEEEYHEKVWRSVLAIAKSSYELTWVDAYSGKRNFITSTLLSEADLVIVNLPQNAHVLDLFFNGDLIPEELLFTRYMIIIGQYDEKSSLSLKNIKRKYRVKVPIYSIPYFTAYKDAFNNQRTQEFFYRAVKSVKKDYSYHFMNEVRMINKQIKKELQLDKAEKEDEDWS
ncbi:hypothetical protein [Bacillus cihuensis]|uniref:hypothetical protein n=1 Tax=Bacillus cihuensis TaxID=1208599 RepID=UPI000414270E|nr:hypothetical protein [Bacillus cihuensis]